MRPAIRVLPEVTVARCKHTKSRRYQKTQSQNSSSNPPIPSPGWQTHSAPYTIPFGVNPSGQNMFLYKKRHKTSRSDQKTGKVRIVRISFTNNDALTKKPSKTKTALPFIILDEGKAGTCITHKSRKHYTNGRTSEELLLDRPGCSSASLRSSLSYIAIVLSL